MRKYFHSQNKHINIFINSKCKNLFTNFFEKSTPNNYLFSNSLNKNFHYNNTNKTKLFTTSLTKSNNIIPNNILNFSKKSFTDSFKEKEDYMYIIGIRSRTLKSIKRDSSPLIDKYTESLKLNSLSFNDLKDVEQIYMKLDKEDKISSTMKICHIFVKKNYYSKHLIDYFIDNCTEIAEDSLFNLNSFIYYINGLDLKPNQINFNPNFFKIIEENFFKEGVLMDLMDMKVYMRFFYRFKNSFSQKLLNYSERCLIYLLENTNSFTIHNLYQVNEIIKYCFISGSDRCFQKIVDYYTKMILMKSTSFTESYEYLKIISVLTGKSLKSENILNYSIKYDILINGFDKIKSRIYEYLQKEKVEVNFLKNLLHIMLGNNSLGYFKGINFKDLIVSYIMKNENELGPDNLRTLLKYMCRSRNFMLKYQNEINQLILSNLSELENMSYHSMVILYNYLRNSSDPNPEIKAFTELLILKCLIIRSRESINGYPFHYLTQRYIFNELIKKEFSGFLGFTLVEVHDFFSNQLMMYEKNLKITNEDDEDI